MDRFDLYCESEPVEHAKLLQTTHSTSEDMAAIKHIGQARLNQQNRYNSGEKLNASLGNREITSRSVRPNQPKIYSTKQLPHWIFLPVVTCELSKLPRQLLTSTEKVHFPAHLAEALQYRTQNLTTLT